MRLLKSKIVAIFVMLAFSAQVLAMPFFACCDEMRQMQSMVADDAGTINHSSHHMQSAQHDAQAIHVHQSVGNQTEKNDCDIHCDFCGVASLAMQSESFSAQAGHSTLQNFFSFVTPPAVADSLFRPPISA